MIATEVVCVVDIVDKHSYIKNVYLKRSQIVKITILLIFCVIFLAQNRIVGYRTLI